MSSHTSKAIITQNQLNSDTIHELESLNQPPSLQTSLGFNLGVSFTPTLKSG